MDKIQIKNLIQKMIEDNATQNLFGVAETSFHTHNGIDSPQLNPSALLGFPVFQVADATIAPTDSPQSGTWRFYVDTTPNYRLWAYLAVKDVVDGGLGIYSAWNAVNLNTGGGGSPAGSNLDVQFNDSGNFGGSDNFTYQDEVALNLTNADFTIRNGKLVINDGSIDVVTIDPDSTFQFLPLGNFQVLTQSATGMNVPGTIEFTAGNSGDVTVDGAIVRLIGGSTPNSGGGATLTVGGSLGTGEGGQGILSGGNAGVASGANGGIVTIQGGIGDTAGDGAVVNIIGGDGGDSIASGTGNAGDVNITGGQAGSNNPRTAGNVTITGGGNLGSAPGGTISILGGYGAGGSGSIVLNTQVDVSNDDGGNGIILGFADGTLNSGYPMMPLSAGPPSGAPPNGSFIYDSSNDKLYIYNSGWKSVTLT